MPIKFISREDQLLRQLSQRDPAALQSMIRVYFPVLCRFAEKFLPDSALAKDIVQETFVKFWLHTGSFASFPELKGFLYTITRNGCLNLQRGRMRETEKIRGIALMGETEFVNNEELANDEIVRLEHLAEISRLVSAMPARMQEVFLCSFEEGLTIDQIAKRMRISVKTVRNQKYKSLQILRNHFGKRSGALLILLGLLLK